MTRFDYMNFYGGKDNEFVAHAKKYTQAQAIALFIKENITEYTRLRKPTTDDITRRQVRYFVSWPSSCNAGEFDSAGGYTYCNAQDRGSFPVWVIKFEDLRVKENER